MPIQRKLAPDIAALRKDIAYNPVTGELINIRKRGRCAVGKVLGSKDVAGYTIVVYNNTQYKAHHIVWFLHTGIWAYMLDHIDGNKSNNSITNLRIATHTDNNRNHKLRCTNTSGITGVSFYTKCRRWSAEIFENGKKISLGWFNDFDDAVNARLLAEARLGYSKQHGKRI